MTQLKKFDVLNKWFLSLGSGMTQMKKFDDLNGRFVGDEFFRRLSIEMSRSFQVQTTIVFKKPWSIILQKSCMSSNAIPASSVTSTPRTHELRAVSNGRFTRDAGARAQLPPSPSLPDHLSFQMGSSTPTAWDPPTNRSATAATPTPHRASSSSAPPRWCSARAPPCGWSTRTSPGPRLRWYPPPPPRPRSPRSRSFYPPASRWGGNEPAPCLEAPLRALQPTCLSNCLAVDWVRLARLTLWLGCRVAGRGGR